MKFYNKIEWSLVELAHAFKTQKLKKLMNIRPQILQDLWLSGWSKFYDMAWS